MQLPEISEEQIERIVSAFHIECDEQRHAILKCRESVDIRACAGSGKTTLLVAKLALVASLSADRHGGLCILSHTNVAHAEIRKKFGIMPHLRRLESYPHHLGTIQSFINLFLGVPGTLARFRLRPVVVNDDLFAARALRIVTGGSYTKARQWLMRQSNAEALIAGLRLHENQGQLEMESAGGDIPAKTTPTGKALRQLKYKLITLGVFRYDDMDAIGSWYIKTHPAVLPALRRRFPIVFLDEAQDTSARHEALLDYLFGKETVIQRFGDDRQAIFSEKDQEDRGGRFPKPHYLSMSTSLRLSPSIARLAEHACIGAVEPLGGRPNAHAHNHTVFVFSNDKICKVLPAFAELVGAEIGGGLSAKRVMAVGFRRRGVGSAEKAPESIHDYWPGGIPHHRTSSTRFDHLSGYLAAARADAFASPAVTNATSRLLEAACRILEIQDVTRNGHPYTPWQLMRTLKGHDSSLTPVLPVLISRLLLKVYRGEFVPVDSLAAVLRVGLAPIYDGIWNAGVDAFCNSHQQGGETDPASAPRESDGIFRHQTPRGLVQVGLSTIHGVKGETMDATLVLSTHYYSHDLQQLIEGGPLRGKRPTAEKAEQVRFQGHIRRAYVGMTRATKLLCLAIREDHITASQRLEMEALGWRFQYL